MEAKCVLSERGARIATLTDLALSTLLRVSQNAFHPINNPKVRLGYNSHHDPSVYYTLV